MSVDKEPSPKGSDHTELMLVGLLLGLAAFTQVWPKIHAFWIDHRVTIMLMAWIAVVIPILLLIIKLWNAYVSRCEQRAITAQDDTAVYLGKDCGTGESIFLRQEFRPSHLGLLGTTGTGKSEAVVCPLFIQDVKNGSGALLIDGKSELSFANKLYSYVKHYGRENDFRLFSLCHPERSYSFNPLRGETAQEVTERVFSSFTFENEYFKHIQYKNFLGIIRLIYMQKEVPTFSLVHRLLSDMDALDPWVAACPNEGLRRDMGKFMKLSEREREEKMSGLDSMLSHFTSCEVAGLFEETENGIDIDEAMEKGQLLYFQLPTMYYPIQGAATGKLVLQCLQSAVSKRQIRIGESDGN